MKSILEKKQAIRMDHNGWTWKYEPRRFYGKDDTYLPDFWVDMGRGVDCYLEVKGAFPKELWKVQRRMQIVWDTKPRAFLALVIDANDSMCGARGETRKWKWL